MKCQYVSTIPAHGALTPNMRVKYMAVLHHQHEQHGNKHRCAQDKTTKTCHCDCHYAADTTATQDVHDLAKAKVLRDQLHDRWLDYSLKLHYKKTRWWKKPDRWWTGTVTDVWLQRHGDGWRPMIQLTFPHFGDEEHYDVKDFLQLKKAWDKHQAAVKSKAAADAQA
eukprot:g1192.t1